jgi:GNAT superfamily N-acetyltransferase
MPNLSFAIRPIEPAEIPLLKDFAPPDWHIDLADRCASFWGRPFFHSIVAEAESKIVGCASALFNPKAGWLGNIIVLPECHRRGIGGALTRGLMDFLEGRGCPSQVLIATEAGEPVYGKLGFVTRSTYTFLRRDRPVEPGAVERVRRSRPEDFPAILEIDREISGEERAPFLEGFLAGSWVYPSDPARPIEGFYLPGLEQGPILARNSEAGLELLRFKLNLGSTSITLPTANETAIDYLTGTGFRVASVRPRMTFGPDTDWRPDLVFSRGSGYSG